MNVNTSPHSGFNLIELMVVLAIFSIISSIAFPSFQSIFESIRTNHNIRNISQTIQFARNMAINYGIRVTVCPVSENKCSSNWQQGISVFSDSGLVNQLDGEDTVLQVLSPFNKNDIIQYNRNAIRFQPDGLASGTNGTLTYCPTEHTSPYSKAVIINQAGRVRYSTKKDIVCKL